MIARVRTKLEIWTSLGSTRLAALNRSAPACVRSCMGREYVFVDEWEVEAPIVAVFRALSDATTYPDWWQPVYLSAEADGPLRVGRVARERFKGRLP